MDERLEIRTLGTLSIRHNGVLVDNFVTRKAEMLLVYLACTGRSHLREALAEMLWEERAQGQSLANLRVVLTNLRQTVAPFISITRKDVAINPASTCWVDVRVFESRAGARAPLLDDHAAQQLEQALDLYQGSFLEGFYVDSRYFEEWIRLEQERLRLLMLDALDQLVGYYTRARDYSAGIRWAARALQMDNLREETYRQLMYLLALSGQRHAALIQYETCCQMLDEALGVPAAPETVALFEQIQSGEISAAQSPISGMAEVIPAVLVRGVEDLPGRSRPPRRLIGRDQVCAEVQTLLADNQRVLLQGFAGAGKTALAATIAQRFIEAGQLPLVWLQVGNEHAGAVLEALMNCLGERSGGASGQSADQQIAALLNHHQVRLIVLDDAWNGAALDQVLRVLPPAVPVLVTSRSRFPLLHHIGVPMLPRAAALELLGHHARSSWAADAGADQLCQTLGDLPFALRIAGEMLALDDLHPAELLDEIADAPHMVQMPAGFEENEKNIAALLQASLHSLDDADRETFMTIGRLFARGTTSALLALVMQRDEPLVRQSLRMLQRRGLADREGQADPGPVYYSIHDLAYSYARSEQAGGARSQQQILEACLHLARAHYQHNLGLLHVEQGNLLGAAQAAYQTGQYPLLIELMLLLTAESQYLNTYGHTLSLTERTDEAIAAARQLGSKQIESLHYLLGKRGNMYYERGDLARAVACYQEAGEIAYRLAWTGRYILALCVSSKVRSEQGETLAAQAGLEEAYRLAQIEEDAAMLARVLENWAVHAFTHGDYEKTRELARQEVELAEQYNDTRSRFNGLYNWGSAEQKLGRFEQSLPLLQQALEIAQAEEVIRWRAASLHLLAVTYNALGQHTLAVQYLDDAAELFRQSGFTVKVRELENLRKEIHAHTE